MSVIDARKMTNESCVITAICDMDGEISHMAIPMSTAEFEDAHEAWQCGKMIQDAFPMLSAEQREFIMTGISPQKWNEMFGVDGE